MAELKNILDNTYIDFKLKFIDKPTDRISYDLSISTKQNGETSEFLKMSNNKDRTLYLEIEPKDEVHELCASLENLVLGGKDYFTFEPLNEKDFCLEIVSSKTEMGIFFRIRLFTDQQITYSMPGIQMYVSKADFSNFTYALYQEYDDIMNQIKLREKTFVFDGLKQKTTNIIRI